MNVVDNVHAQKLGGAIESGDATVGIIGLGYVGLPLGRAFIAQGFSTIGFDIDAEKIDCLNRGETYLKTIPESDIKAMVASGKFHAEKDFAELAKMDAIIMCVPTPLTGDHEPDLSYVTSTTETIAKYLRAGQLVVLESTTYPGTTSEIIRPLLEAGGLKSGEDFFLAYSPEREDPGNESHGTAKIPKVVGGDGPIALSLAEALYGNVVAGTVPVSSLETAEAVKLTENIFRSVNIALVNELKLIYDKMGIDIWEVVDAAKSKPFGYMPFYPGPGLGGHCIPIDPFYLSWKAKQYGQPTQFIELAGEINTAMPDHVVGVLAAQLKSRFGKDLSGAKVLLMGVAYKRNVDDVRESPAFRLIEIMEEGGAAVDFHDPFVDTIPHTRKHDSLSGRSAVPWDPAAFAAYDVALICTDHSDVDYAGLVEAVPLVIDTRNATANVSNSRDKIVKA
jgi:UDP-N-acetyl-D-glucosamine dehydrogenase